MYGENSRVEIVLLPSLYPCTYLLSLLYKSVNISLLFIESVVPVKWSKCLNDSPGWSGTGYLLSKSKRNLPYPLSFSFFFSFLLLSSTNILSPVFQFKVYPCQLFTRLIFFILLEIYQRERLIISIIKSYTMYTCMKYQIFRSSFFNQIFRSLLNKEFFFFQLN